MNAQPVIIVLTQAALPLAQKLAKTLQADIHGSQKRLDGDPSINVLFNDAISHIGALFTAGRPIIGLCASGILIRAVAPHLGDKHSEPPVLAINESGQSIVPLLGGHNGANTLARKIADDLAGHAAITTAGDAHFGVALDEPPKGWTLANKADAKRFMAALLNGGKVKIRGTLPFNTENLPQSENADLVLESTVNHKTGSATHLVYHSKNLVMGLGAIRNADPARMIALAEQVLADANLSPSALSCICSHTVKADEAAIHAVAKHFGIPARFLSAETLEAETPRLKNPSDIVFAEVGCHGVAEAGALAGVGATGHLIVEKQKIDQGTCAIAEATNIIDPQTIGRARGRLAVVGLGPGQPDWQTPEVSRLVADADHLVGYSLYLDLLGAQANGKTRHDFPLGAEEDRVRHALVMAGEGKSVALVCSGDPGIYAMATLVWECLDQTKLPDGAKRVEIITTPGISALQAASARAGAILGHDFCTISLSDLLTPWDAIQTRIEAAAKGDFVIAFYNPVSKRRRTQLAYAKEILLQHRPADTPVILGTNLGRTEEQLRIVDLGDLNVDDVDMLTVVLVGSSASRRLAFDGGTKVYTPRGYARKRETITKEAAE
ncbi:precorrin-3B C(17)-methyltransferase [Pararhizobium sp. IMCC21322]|uniref:precorrin-3B C(17)-methyltransferase n=1 Tax=Pararhizobium sp. IMCC21322 TaxID=3067903 RepID=UPI002741EF9F|nr:precorrin-3B C(17)-methyltransferase [Pararhizobium sp. IMCC21322]